MSVINNEHLIRTNSPDIIRTEKRSRQANNAQEYLSIGQLSSLVQEDSQGYFGLLAPFYFDGVATDTVIELEDVDTWYDVELVVDANGTFDYRPKLMKDTGNPAVTGTGAAGDPIEFSLEGLTLQSFANFRASMSFRPDEDGGRLESRLLFTRHEGAIPNTQFPIEEVSLAMESGADIDYIAEPMLSFFVGDTIDTDSPGNAGSCRFQIKTDVPGTLSLRALTWYIQQ